MLKFFYLNKERGYYMSGFQCPYCSMVMSISPFTYVSQSPSFSFSNGEAYKKENGETVDPSTLRIAFYKCPNCGQISINALGIGTKVKDVNMQIRPISLAKHYPEYIPENIRKDYEEACAIVDLSPKASATLARRCLQGMIRDFFDVHKRNLYEEIDAIKDKIPTDQWKVLDSLRRIGNIGAHMEKDINLIVDIDPNEAQKLLKLIELLIKQWYIERHDREQLYSDIIGIDQDKQKERKKTE